MSTAQPQLASDQLASLVKDARHAIEEARNLLTYNHEEVLQKRTSPGSWSPLECVVHLNLSLQAMLPGIRHAVETAPESAKAKPDYKMDFAGRLLAWSLEPPVLFKMKAPKTALPLEAAAPESVLREFNLQHEELVELLHASASKAIDQVKMKSPFANIHYSVYSAFRIIAAHDRRHLWQARKSLSR